MPEFLAKPERVEAKQWQPGDIEAAGDVIGWLTAAGARHQILRGLGEHCVLGLQVLLPQRYAYPVVATVEVRPGDWVIRRADGTFTSCAEQNFAEEYARV